MSLPITDKANPKPFTLSTLTLYIRDCRDKDGKVYDFSGAEKIYATLKDALTDSDATAAVFINSTDNPTQFVTTYAANGALDVVFSTTNTNLTPDITYYVDVKAVWSGGTAIPIVADTVVFQQAITRAIT